MPDTTPFRWRPDRSAQASRFADVSTLTAMRRGLAGRCPACGHGRIFATWLGVVSKCAACAAPLGLIAADDAPPYFTVFIVAHVVIGALLALERSVTLPVATELAIFLPGTLALVLVLIRPVKGATVGMMMKLGFMKPPEDGPRD